MAQNINYGSEIKNGGTIKSEHVSQFVDAFTGAEAYDINISGSLNVVGTTSGSFIGDGSGLTGITGGGGTGSLTTKAGSIPTSSFVSYTPGNLTRTSASVTFLTPFSSSDYQVFLEFSEQIDDRILSSLVSSFDVINQTTTGFGVVSSVSQGDFGFYQDNPVSYLAIADTETSVFTIPTSSFGLNTKVGFVSSASFQTTGSSDSFATITFSTPFSSSDYSVAVEFVNPNQYFSLSNDFEIKNKTTESFQLFSTFDVATLWGNPLYPGCSVDYIAVAQGETAVTSSFTVSSSYASTSTSASYAETASLSLNDLTRQSIQVVNGTASISRELLIPDDIEVVLDYTLSADAEGNLQPCTIINFPNTLRRVEFSGFSGHKISDLSFPSTLTYLGSSSFQNTTAQTISASNLIEIGPQSFQRLTSTDLENLPFLESLTLNEGLTIIGDSSFSYANFTPITSTDFGGLVTITDYDPIKSSTGFNYFKWTGSIDLTIPSTVDYIGKEAFAGHKIKNLIFTNPSSSLLINSASFHGNLFDTVDFPTYPTYTSSLELLDSLSIGDNTTIGQLSFGRNTIKTASIGDNCTLYDRIFHKPYNNTFISQLVLPDSTIFPPISSSFGSTWKVGSLNKSLITELVFSGSGWTKIPSYLFGENSFEDNIQTSGSDDDFYSTLGSFPTLTGTNIDTIGTASFMLIDFLTESISIPNNIEVSRYAFFSTLLNNPASASNLNTITIGDNCTLQDASFTQCSVSTLTIGSNVSLNPTNANGGVFPNSTTLTSPRYVKTLSYLRKLNMGENCNIGGFTFKELGNKTQITGSFTIPTGTILNTSSFEQFATTDGTTGFSELIISGSGITSIPSSCFKQSGINTLTFNGSALETIGVNGFQNNDITGSVTFPSTLTNIGSSAFDGNNNLATASIPTACITASNSFESSVHIIRF